MVDAEGRLKQEPPPADFLDNAALIAALVDLVRIPSVYDAGRDGCNERETANCVCRLLDGWGIDYQRWDVAPGRPNIVADIVGGDGPTLVLEGHMDVVTAGDRREWERDPFGGEIAGGRLYGRGAADMKGGLTAMLFAAGAIKQSGMAFPGTLRLAVLSDEEGMMQGARAFVEDGYLADASAAIICEPEGGRVCLAQKGALRIAVTLRGSMAHACMPDEGANPLLALGVCIVALKELENDVLGRHPVHPLLGRFSLTPTVVSGGADDQANVIPASASLRIDVRTGPEHDHSELLERIRETCRLAASSVSGVEAEVILLDDRPATETEASDPIVDATISAHWEVFGNTPPIGGVPGSTDGTIFWMKKQLPLVVWGPGDTTIPHQANEFVRLDDVTGYARAYIRAALRYFDAIGASR